MNLLESWYDTLQNIIMIPTSPNHINTQPHFRCRYTLYTLDTLKPIQFVVFYVFLLKNILDGHIPILFPDKKTSKQD